MGSAYFLPIVVSVCDITTLFIKSMPEFPDRVIRHYIRPVKENPKGLTFEILSFLFSYSYGTIDFPKIF